MPSKTVKKPSSLKIDLPPSVDLGSSRPPLTRRFSVGSDVSPTHTMVVLSPGPRTGPNPLVDTCPPQPRKSGRSKSFRTSSDSTASSERDSGYMEPSDWTGNHGNRGSATGYPGGPGGNAFFAGGEGPPDTPPVPPRTYKYTRSKSVSEGMPVPYASRQAVAEMAESRVRRQGSLPQPRQHLAIGGHPQSHLHHDLHMHKSVSCPEKRANRHSMEADIVEEVEPPQGAPGRAGHSGDSRGAVGGIRCWADVPEDITTLSVADVNACLRLLDLRCHFEDVDGRLLTALDADDIMTHFRRELLRQEAERIVKFAKGWRPAKQ